MTAWTEQQTTIVITEWCIVGVGSYGISRWLLLREGDIILDAILLSERVSLFSYLCLEKLHVFVRYSEVNMCLAIRCSIERTLYQMFLHWCAWALGILMEEQQTLWQLTVVQSLSFQHIGGYSLIVAFCYERLDTLALILLASCIECIEESKVLNLVEVFLLKVGCGHIVVSIHEGKHVLKHAAGSTRGWHELNHALALCLVCIPSCLQSLALISIRGNDSITDSSGCLQLQKWETSLKLIQLILNLLLGDTLLSNLFQVLL